MKQLENGFKLIAGLVALVPGITLFLGEEFYNYLEENAEMVVGIGEAVCFLCLGLVVINQKKLKGLSSSRITRTIILTFIGFLITFFTTLYAHGRLVVKYDPDLYPTESKVAVFPLFATDGILEEAEHSGSSVADLYSDVKGNPHELENLLYDAGDTDLAVSLSVYLITLLNFLSTALLVVSTAFTAIRAGMESSKQEKHADSGEPVPTAG